MDICDFIGDDRRRVLYAQVGDGGDPVLLYGGMHRLDAGEGGARFKDHFTWHCVLAGQAEAEVDGLEYRLGVGDGFLYLPREEKRLRAAAGGCTWCWIGFDAVDLRQECAAFGVNCCRVITGFDRAFRALQLSLLAELQSPGIRHEQECSARLQLLITAVLRKVGTLPTPVVARHEAITKAQRLLAQRAGTGMTVADLARAVGLERSYFSRLFHQELGITVRDALAAARLRLAERLLTDHTLPIRAVAEMSGFEEYFSFHRFFKRQRGMSPSAFRQRSGG